MDSYSLPDAVEPDYWFVCFHPSRGVWRILGRFQHVSAFAYVAGFRAWIVYDVQWSGLRIALFGNDTAMRTFISYTKNCTVVRFTRQYRPLIVASRLGFYCVPAVKSLLGLSCVAVTPDALYRHLMANGGVLLSERVSTADTARPDAGRGASAGAK